LTVVKIEEDDEGGWYSSAAGAYLSQSFCKTYTRLVIRVDYKIPDSKLLF